MSEGAKWYVVHTYSGYENAVMATILKSAENRKMQDLILEVKIPMETVTEVEEDSEFSEKPSGKKKSAGKEKAADKEKTVDRKVFPGYVFVKMIMTDESWLLVRNVRGVTGFVGEANKAIPLKDEEVYAFDIEKRVTKVGYDVGSKIKVINGALEGFLGTVEEIDTDKNAVRVVVSMFGRETPVDLALDEIEKVDD
jgi:transcription termination/antitermination protein NusG